MWRGVERFCLYMFLLSPYSNSRKAKKAQPILVQEIKEGKMEKMDSGEDILISVEELDKKSFLGGLYNFAWLFDPLWGNLGVFAALSPYNPFLYCWGLV